MSGNKTQRPPAPGYDSRFEPKTMASTPGGTNKAMWNTQFMSGNGGAKPAPQPWNTRFDYQPKAGGSYRTRGSDGNMDAWNLTPTGMNAKKPF